MRSGIGRELANTTGKTAAARPIGRTPGWGLMQKLWTTVEKAIVVLDEKERTTGAHLATTTLIGWVKLPQAGPKVGKHTSTQGGRRTGVTGVTGETVPLGVWGDRKNRNNRNNRENGTNQTKLAAHPTRGGCRVLRTIVEKAIMVLLDEKEWATGAHHSQWRRPPLSDKIAPDWLKLSRTVAWGSEKPE